MSHAYLYDHVRTPRGRGRADGALHEITPVQLATQTLAALRDRNRVDTRLIDDVILATAMPVGEQGANLARTAAVGAIAMGHPLAATGAMLIGTVLDELERRNLNTAVVILCAAIGMATATIIERL